MEEFKLHNLINSNKSVQEDICKLIGVDYSKVEFVHEDTYINEITADFTIKEDNLVDAIIECKGSNLSVTDYVRGIGQILQYGYFADNKLSKKGYEFREDTKSLLIFPSSLIKNCNFNIGLFRYPKNSIIIEINDTTNAVREISSKELEKLKEAENNKLVTISQYYLRDNRIYEYFILLQYLTYLKITGHKQVDRKEIEKNFLTKLETVNNGNWRNAFITLSSLGFIDSNNIPTSSGAIYGTKDYEFFASDIFDVYIKPYIIEIFDIFNNIEGENISISNRKICEEIRKKHHNRDVLFLTDSDSRYMSSWLNILRDDFGCIDFKPRSNDRKIIYNPCKFNKDSLIKEIKSKSKAYRYIERYHKLVKYGEWR